jgi:hypothetical protein
MCPLAAVWCSGRGGGGAASGSRESTARTWPVVGAWLVSWPPAVDLGRCGDWWGKKVEIFFRALEFFN